MQHDIRILAVDDEPLTLRHLQLILKEITSGGVETASCGPEALDKAASYRPDIILMDIRLDGDMDGIEAAREIDRLHGIPVIFMTALADSETLDRAKDANPFGFVVKPIDQVRLQSALDIAVSRIRHEDVLRASEERYRQLFEGMLNGFVLYEAVADGQGKPVELRCLDINPAFERITGLTRKEVQGKLMHEALPGAEQHWIETMGAVAVSGVPASFEQYSQDLNQYLSIKAYCPEPGKVAAVFEDVTEQRRAETILAHRTFHDPLTGLPNRSLCLDRINRAMERARRRQNYTYAVMFLDLDRFKLVNDSLGHATGDKLLRFVAEELKGFLRNLDTLARIGGDEFVILLEEIKYPAEAIIVARRIKDFFLKPVHIDGHAIYVTASIGIVLGPADYEHSEDLLRNANLAMNAARRLGGSRFKVFKWSMLDEARNVLDAETNLRLAIDNREFVLHYQPIVSLSDLKLLGFEALVRWKRGDSLVAPYDFIPLAEETGLILPIGQIVLEEACAMMSGWLKKYPSVGPLTIAVNLSAKQFLKTGLVKMIARVLADTELPPQCLKLEVTETAIMEDPRSAALKLGGIKSLGAAVAIDDFGTGYSSLSHLISFPLDTLKIDRTFVCDMDNRLNLAVVRTVINLGHTLGHGVIAEGIETERQLAKLKTLGCEAGQGFLFAKPLPAQAAEELIRARSAMALVAPETS
ncbi:MAG: EAL domain-containing protein [Desulfovibrionaceae bacterium]|nr:EAL domain-containing protein [Desulfovibrionaceae bacterium]MBF0513118.1 EAL domain-containing protein [Desulfovibrionaceae bacterium]